MQDNFVQEYIKKCVSQGKQSVGDICNFAKEEILTIDEDLKKMEVLRSRQTSLRALLKQMGVEPTKRAQPVSSIINTGQPFADLDPFMQNMCIAICNFVEKINRSTTSREIMDNVSKPEENKTALISIKWLWENGCFSRDENTREIKIGNNWENRPKEKALCEESSLN